MSEINDLIILDSDDQGFIFDLKKFIIRKTQTNPAWANAVAITTFTSILDQNLVVHTDIGDLRLNNFFLTIGPSGIARKSLPLKYVMKPILYKYEELTDHEVTLPSRFTVEGMFEYLSNADRNKGVIVRDEFTSFFKDVTNKKYLSDQLEFLSELHDGTLEKRYTRSFKLEHPKNFMVSLIAATTPYLFTILSSDFFLQGIGNRIIFIFDDEEVDIDSYRIVSANPFQKHAADELLIHDFAMRLAAIKNTDIRRMGFETGSSVDKIDKWSKESLKKAQKVYRLQKTDRTYSYLSRLHEKAIKLAAVHALSYNEQHLNSMGDTIIIRENSVDWAIELCKTYWKFFLDMIDEWDSMTQERPPTSEKANIERALAIIKKNGGKIMHSTLKKQLWLKNIQFTEIINFLIDTKRIKSYKPAKQEPGKTGQIPRFYKLIAETDNDNKSNI